MLIIIMDVSDALQLIVIGVIVGLITKHDNTTTVF